MSRIIEKNVVQDFRKCNKCGSIIAFDEDDFEWEMAVKRSLCNYAYVKCLECGDMIFVKSD
jgi:DNA-directed RNA polymerase subunit RPC12/RpoP